MASPLAKASKKFTDFQVADLGLAEWGRKELQVGDLEDRRGVTGLHRVN